MRGASGILVSGGAGYVGSHVVQRLVEAGRNVVVVDNLESGHREAVRAAALVVGDVRDSSLLDAVIADYGVGSALHFAGYKNAGDSMLAPGRYFDTNVNGSLVLFDALERGGVDRVVFSSSCAVYGTPQRLPIDESAPLQPDSPYGESKRIVELMLGWFDACSGIRSVSLRYFNAAGASLDGATGEDWSRSANLIPVAMKATLGAAPPIRVFGSDYPTPDGTAVRDYVHVLDLVDAHVRALEYLEAGGSSIALNLGTGRPASVIDVVEEIRRASGRRPPIEWADRRRGDPAVVYADSSLAAETLGWKARYGIEEIIQSAWRWHSTHYQGSESVAPANQPA
jgi:UDP-glucose-4-epimerase GalE